MITLDFETRATVKLAGSTGCGGWVYSEHPETHPICLAYSIDDIHLLPKVWIPEWVVEILEQEYTLSDYKWIETEPNSLFFELDAYRTLVEAHNSFFERAIWKNVMVKKYDWPEIKHEQWRCSAARAASLSLPRKLEDVANALGLSEQKDMTGHKVMQKISKPRKPLKIEKEIYGDKIKDMVFWHENPDEFMTVIKYCRQDVITEMAVSKALGELQPKELKVWQVDQAINERGMFVDLELSEIALEIEAEEKLILDIAARKASDNFGIPYDTIISLSQRQKVLDWIISEGVEIPNMQAGTIDEYLENEDLPENVRIVLQGRRDFSKIAIKKYASILRRHSIDQRIRDNLMYSGAGTGRWTGRGVQTQNLIRGKMTHPEIMCDLVKEKDFEMLELIFGKQKPLDWISWTVRGAFMAPPGRDLIAGDYSSIEARGTMWLAGEEEALEAFRANKDIYILMAAEIFNVDPESIDPDTPDGAFMRFLGKQAILGLGYEMGWRKFQKVCKNYGIIVSDELAKQTVKTYRTKYIGVKICWKEFENAAIKAVRNPGKKIKVSYVSYIRTKRFLFCILPSGRYIAYFNPKLKSTTTPWGEPTVKLTYMSADGQTGKWRENDTYGGKLFENVCQGICRDIMAEAMLRLEHDSVYDVVNTVHDELISEVDENKGSIEAYISILCAQPKWAKGFPINAKAWRGKRYRKD